MPKPVEAILLGAGQRGHFAYGSYALQHSDDLRFVAVAEPHPERRRRFAAAHRIPDSRQFEGWEELLSRGQIAEACINATQDRDHHPLAIAALQAGYDLLLEKPLAPRLEECVSVFNPRRRRGGSSRWRMCSAPPPFSRPFTRS